MEHILLQLRGFRLTTAEIIYYLPDYPDLLQSYIWQEYDQLPDLPTLHRFLDFWEQNLDGKLHSVNVTSIALIKPQELLYLQSNFRIH